MSFRYYDVVASPLGELLLGADERGLSGLHMQDGPRPLSIDPGWRRQPRRFAALRAQLDQYFAGERVRFELELSLGGSEWQARVWRALREIPYGHTLSYGALAARLGRPAAARAVGLANARNPVAIVVPCHRLVGAEGSLTGYGGGVERKRALLELEARSQPGPSFCLQSVSL